MARPAQRVMTMVECMFAVSVRLEVEVICKEGSCARCFEIYRLLSGYLVVRLTRYLYLSINLISMY